MTERGITLERREAALVPFPLRGDGFRVRVDALDPVGLPAEVFGHVRRLVDPHTSTFQEDFLFVASPTDLVEYPAHEPDDSQTPPFFRKASLDVVVGSRSLADTLWQLVREEVAVLLEALDRQDGLVVLQSVRLGAEPVPDEESLSVSA